MTYRQKSHRAFHPLFAVLAVLAGLFAFTGCQTSRPDPLTKLQRFHEAGQASAVIKYDSWDYIFMLQPAVMDGNYRRVLKIDDLGGVIRNQGIQRNLAVVLIGWQYSADDHYRIGQRWHETLRAEGFQRVVCIKPISETKLNGSPVVYDSAVAGVRVAAVAP